MLPRRPRPSVHYKYWLFILVLLIIGLVTEKWSSRENFTSYLSNASTLTSLLLGLVAIFYSFISNDSLSRGLGGITVVSKEIGETREKIADYLQQAESANQVLASSKVSLEKAKDLIAEDLKGLGQVLKKVEEQSQGLIKIVDNIPSRLEKVESGVGDLATLFQSWQTSNFPDPNPGEIASAESFAKEFMTRTSPDINLLIIALVLAAKTDNSFTFQELARALLKETTILVGQIIVLSSLSLVKLKFMPASESDVSQKPWTDKALSVKSIPSIFLDEAENALREKLGSKSSRDGMERYETVMQKVHQLFPS